MRKPYCCEGVNKNGLSSERSLSVPRIHKESTYAAQEKSPSCERALGHGRPTASHVLSSRTAPDCLSPLSSKVSAIITHPSHPVWDSLAAEQWAVGQTDSVLTVFQAWWTERCWSRWSEATGCRVLRAARSRCTKWCGSAGRKSQTSGPLSSTSSPSSRTTSPPLSHSTSPETTCRDPLRDPETHHHVLISHQDGSQTHCGTSSQQLPCTLVLTEIFGCFCFFLFSPQELNVKTTSLTAWLLSSGCSLPEDVCVVELMRATCVWAGLKQDHVTLPELCWAHTLHRRQRELWENKRWA